MDSKRVVEAVVILRPHFYTLCARSGENGASKKKQSFFVVEKKLVFVVVDFKTITFLFKCVK